MVVKKTFRYPSVFFYYRNAFFLQPLMPQSFIPEHFYGKGYKVPAMPKVLEITSEVDAVSEADIIRTGGIKPFVYALMA